MGPVVFITGGTDGIGFQAARMLVDLGCTVAIHGRDQQKLLSCQRALSDRVRVYCADLSDLDAVRSLAVEVAADVNRLDVLINNAGALKAPVTQTVSDRDLRGQYHRSLSIDSASTTSHPKRWPSDQPLLSSPVGSGL